MGMAWQATGPEVMIGQHSLADGIKSTSLKFAIFDLDSTLIVAKSGEVKTNDPTDWMWWNESVPAKLRQAFDEGLIIIVITNQGRLTTLEGAEAPAARHFRAKVNNIFQILDLPITIYVACGNDNWRKPRTRTWDHLVDSLVPGAIVNRLDSYMVGDAAGRSTDHSDDDRHFAMNLGIRFQTPEEFFLGKQTESWQHKFDPSRHIDLIDPTSNLNLPSRVAREERRWRVGTLENKDHIAPILLLVGLPGSGKTTYCQTFLRDKGYERVTLSAEGSARVRTDTVIGSLKAQKRIAIDDINHNRVSRKPWIELARTHGVPIVAVYFSTPTKLCLHNDAVRALGGNSKLNWEERSIFPITRFWSLVKQFEPPEEPEGFQKVVNIEFEWAGTAEVMTLWRKYWV